MTDRTVFVRLKADISDFQRGMVAAGAGAKALASRLDEADGRMANLVQTGLALAPALVPIGAVATGAIAGLTLQLGLAAAAGGTALLAFHGIGDGLKALNTYQMAPTAANFTKLQQAMDKLGPAGQEFVLTLDHMTPKFRELQSLAERGMLPGVTDGLDQLVKLMPQAREMVSTFSSTLGELSSEAGHSFNDPQWLKFFDYIDRTAGPVLLEMGKTFGNVVAGLANTLQAFDPLSRDFSTGLLNWSRDFKNATANLDQNKGFQNFLTYAQENGPKALDAIAALGRALLAFVEAAAPVGSAVLPVITDLADAFSSLADSSVGPTLIATAAAVGILGRSLALLKAVGLRGEGDGGFIGKNYVAPLKTLPAVLREAKAATLEYAAAEREAGLAHARYIGRLRASSTQLALIPGSEPSKGATAAADELVAANKRVSESSKRVAEAEQAKSSALTSGRGAFLKGAAGAAGLTIAMSGMADSFGLSNTASLALIGTMAGPWGTALGAGVGLVKDLAAANNDLETAVNASNRAMSGTGLAEQAAGLQNLGKSLADYQQKADKPLGFRDFAAPGAGIVQHLTQISDLWTHAGDKAQESLAKQGKAFMNVRGSLTDLQDALGGLDWHKGLVAGTREATVSLTGLQTTLNTTLSAFSAAGKSQSEAMAFLNKGPNSQGWEAGKRLVLDYVQGMDSAQGKSKAVSDALAQLGNQMDTNVNQADALKAAMDALFGVELNQSQATDAAVRALEAMRKAVKAAGKDLLTNKTSALDARDGIRAYVSAQLDKVNADAAADGSGRKAALTLLKTRDNIIAAAKAAGIGAKGIRALVSEMGLTPSNLVTIIRTPGLLSAREQVKALGHLYGLTPKQLKTVISAIGSDKSQAQIRALLKTYGLTPRQIQTLLTAVDQASAKARAAKKAHEDFAKSYQAYLKAQDSASPLATSAKEKALKFARAYLATLKANDAASGVISHVQGLINAMHGKTIDITTHYFDVHTSYKTRGNATGGHIRGPGTETSDSIPARLSDNEYVIKAAAVRKYGVAMFDSLNAMAFANGGLVKGYAGGGHVGTVNIDGTIEHYAHSIKGVTRELNKLAAELKNSSQASNDYANSVRQAYHADFFGGTLGGFDSQVAYETKRVRGVRDNLSKLKAKGLSGALYKDLVASGNASLIGQFAGLSASQIKQREDAYGTHNRIAYQLGTTASNAAFGPQIHSLTDEVRHLRNEIHRLRHGHHIGNMNIHKAVIQDSPTKKHAKRAAQKVRHG